MVRQINWIRIAAFGLFFRGAKNGVTRESSAQAEIKDRIPAGFMAVNT